MSDDEINNAIAEACPNLFYFGDHESIYHMGTDWPADPANDLNTMRNVFKEHKMDDCDCDNCDIIRALAKVVGADLEDGGLVDIALIVNATARQRAAAFLMTVLTGVSHSSNCRST